MNDKIFLFCLIVYLATCFCKQVSTCMHSRNLHDNFPVCPQFTNQWLEAISGRKQLLFWCIEDYRVILNRAIICTLKIRNSSVHFRIIYELIFLKVLRVLFHTPILYFVYCTVWKIPFMKLPGGNYKKVRSTAKINYPRFIAYWSSDYSASNICVREKIFPPKRRFFGLSRYNNNKALNNGTSEMNNASRK